MQILQVKLNLNLSGYRICLYSGLVAKMLATTDISAGQGQGGSLGSGDSSKLWLILKYYFTSAK